MSSQETVLSRAQSNSRGPGLLELLNFPPLRGSLIGGDQSWASQPAIYFLTHIVQVSAVAIRTIPVTTTKAFPGSGVRRAVLSSHLSRSSSGLKEQSLVWTHQRENSTEGWLVE